jgi:hypothetical protein
MTSRNVVVAWLALGFLLGASAAAWAADDSAEAPVPPPATADQPAADQRAAQKPSAEKSAPKKEKAEATKQSEPKRMPPPRRKVSADNPARFPADI